MKLNWITYGVIVGTFLGWIGWDVYLAMHGAATESMILARWASHTIFLPHLIGFLCGHWFFPRSHLWTSGWMWALPIWALLGVWDVVYAYHPTYWQQLARFPLWWVLIGIATGSYLWGQGDGNSPIP